MNNRTSWVLITAAMLSLLTSAHANNLTVTNVAVTPRDDTTAYVQFDISWQNSWRWTNINHDAAWVFFKVLPEGETDWQHATLEGTGSNPTDYSTGSGTNIEIIVPDDRVGLFVRRAAEGSGAVAVQNVKAVWNFASNNLPKTASARLQCFAVEMVYVAEGSFYAGSGGSENGRLRVPGTDHDPVLIGPDPAIVQSEDCSYDDAQLEGDGILVDGDAGIDTDGTTAVDNADYPTGYRAFYCMKYEMSQGQYRDFLNSLTRLQQISRTASQSPDMFAMSGSAGITYRSIIRCPTSIPDSPEPIAFGCDANNNKSLDESSDGMDRACNLLAWTDGAAYADWAGLRPMTELEFEKACRGPLDPVAEEYAWGSPLFLSISGLNGTDNSGSEWYSEGNANLEYLPVAGPVRVGIFAKAGSSRQASGASYWGIMEMSGNVWERPVTIGNATGRAFTGLHGNGILTSNGDADVANWPTTTAVGAGFRGGSFWTKITMSDRVYASLSQTTRTGPGNHNSPGWRGVRSAPTEADR